MTMTSAIRDDELLIERIFDAPPELVFEVWTKPEHLMRWWGPKDFVTVVFDQDFRVGGAYRACIRDASGGDHWMTGTYREIVDGQKIVMSFRWEDGAWGVDNTVTVMFAALAGGRLLQQGQAGHPSGKDGNGFRRLAVRGKDGNSLEVGTHAVCQDRGRGDGQDIDALTELQGQGLVRIGQGL